MKIIHLISGGDVGGAKTHVHSLLCGLAKTEEVQLVCFMDGPFAEEARQLNIPTCSMPPVFWAAISQSRSTAESRRSSRRRIF